MAKVRQASVRGIVRRRPLLALLTAALLAGAIACGTDAGVVAVGPSDEGLIAIINAHGGGLMCETCSSYRLNYSSQDGGLTWRPRDTSREIPAEWRQQGVWRDRNYKQNAVATPRGSYRIDGGDIQLHTPDGEYQTVYSTAYLQSPTNQWLQEQKFGDLSPNTVLSSGPVSITYDPSSGNLIAAMGILGVIVETPEGSWTSVGIGPYYPIDFSGLARVGALLSSVSLWAAVLVFPFSMIALAFTVISVMRMFPVYASVIGYFNPVRRSIISLPMTILFALLAATFAAILLVIVGIYHPDYSSEPIVWFCIMTSPVFSLVSIAGSLDSLEFSTDGAWGFSLRMLAVTAGAFAAMMGSVLLPLLIWAQLGRYLIFAKAVIILLCAAVAVGLIRYYWQASRKVTAPQS